VIHPKNLWEKHWKVLTEDCQYRLEKRNPGTHIELTHQQLQNQGLTDIEEILSHNAQSLKNYPPMPIPKIHDDIGVHNQLIYDEVNYNSETLAAELNELKIGLNTDQRKPYLAILNSCER